MQQFIGRKTFCRAQARAIEKTFAIDRRAAALKESLPC